MTRVGGGSDFVHVRRVHGPQLDECLRHLADGVLHGARLDGPVAGWNAAGPEAVGKEEKDGDRVPGDVVEVRSDARAGTETLPYPPGRSGRVAAMLRLTGMERCCDSAPITAENISGWRVSKRHEVACG